MIATYAVIMMKQGNGIHILSCWQEVRLGCGRYLHWKIKFKAHGLILQDKSYIIIHNGKKFPKINAILLACIELDITIKVSRTFKDQITRMQNKRCKPT